MWTDADVTAVKTALLTAATEGFASVSIAGQSVQSYSLDDLRKILAMMADDVSTSEVSHGGMRLRQLKPGGCG